MSVQQRRPEALGNDGGAQAYRADVLIIGGGPAGTWSAISAARSGASVILADKGFCGTSGATAPSGTGVWYVDPDPEKREKAMASRETLGGFLQDRGWMARVLDRTYDNIHLLTEWGYPFRTDELGFQRPGSVMGPEYMRLMRKRVKQAGAKILDHSPALELLKNDNGAVVGASGIVQQSGERWTVHAGAVVIATGGCAFLSKALGCNVLTGDGYLMGAEVGAELSGMEFSNAYAMSPAYGSVTKTRFYDWATFTDRNNEPIPGAQSKGGRSTIARWLLKGEPVYALIDRATPAEQAAMRLAQPNFFLPLDRAGINPFNQRFPVTLRLEGTVRGTGGLRIVNESCATSVEGLYAAGDAATRELICGAFTGGGSHNAAWAMSSGFWAGAAAADYAQAAGVANPRHAEHAGGAALRDGKHRAYDPDVVTRSVQTEVFPYDRNYFRSAETLEGSLARLDETWNSIASSGPADKLRLVKAREAAAMTATARWMYRSALERNESRGMARRLDFPKQDEGPRYRVHSGGLDRVWTRRDILSEPQPFLEAAE